MAKSYEKPADQKIDATKTYTATIETTEGTITAELYPKIALQLARQLGRQLRDRSALAERKPL